MKELVDYLCQQGCPEALAFKELVEEIKRQCRQVRIQPDGEAILIDPRQVEEVTNE